MNLNPEYLAIVPCPVDLGNEPTLQPGRYLVERSLAAFLLADSDKPRLMDFFECNAAFGTEALGDGDWNGKTLMFVRSGGFGDLLFLTPIFREIKRRWPEAIIKVACFSKYAEILTLNPHVSAMGAYPLPIEEWNAAEGRFWLEGTIEKGPVGRHAVDVLANRIGIAVTDRRMEYFYSQREADAALAAYPRGEKRRRRVGVQVHASAENRTYPFDLLRKVLDILYSRGWEIMLFGDASRVRQLPMNVEGLHVVAGRTFREATAVLATCDVVLAPDSSFCHIAGALEIPTVALYGSFDAATRTAHHASVFALQGQAGCAPCSHHARPGHPWPVGCPARETGACVALETLKPETIADRILSEYVKGTMRRGQAA